MAIFAGGKVLMCHHKCGTSFSLRVIESATSDFKLIDKERRHMPMAALPEEYRDLPIYGLCRNPWSFYVSRWSQRTTEYGETRSFEECLKQDLYSRPGSTFGNVPEDSGYSGFMDEIGCFSAFHLIYHSKNIADCTSIDEVTIDATIIQLHEINRWLVDEWGATSENLKQWRNSGSYGNWRSRYTDKTIGMVADADKWLINRYGYVFP